MECFTSEHAAIGYLSLNLKHWEITQLTLQRSPLTDSVKKKKQEAKKYSGILAPLNCWVSNLTILAPLLLRSFLLVLAPFIIAECVTSQLQVWLSLQISLLKIHFQGQYGKGLVDYKNQEYVYRNNIWNI